MNIRSSALIQSFSEGGNGGEEKAVSRRLDASKAASNAVSNGTAQRSPETRWLWISGATLTGIVALVLLVAESPSSSITPGSSQGNNPAVIVPAP